MSESALTNNTHTVGVHAYITVNSPRLYFGHSYQRILVYLVMMCLEASIKSHGLYCSSVWVGDCDSELPLFFHHHTLNSVIAAVPCVM